MFSTVSFLITLREAIEAALIIGILLVYVTKIDQKKYRKQIWLGTGIGVILSILAAVIFQLVLGGFAGYEEIFEGFAMITASLLLTWMIIWMARMSKNIRRNIESKVDESIAKQQKYGLLALALVSVLREGIETVLFLSGVGAVEESFWIVLYSGILGLVVAIIIAILIFYSGKKINLKWFFIITSILLIIFAAGMITHGFHEFQEIGWFGAETHWLQQYVWDSSAILNDKTSEFGKFLRALFGYQDKPTWLELIVYLGYFVFLGVIFVITRVISKKKSVSIVESTS
ncbi:MAG: FTR1 family iron permease [Candidatus Heimdallarchaeaceae archaeon]